MVVYTHIVKNTPLSKLFTLTLNVNKGSWLFHTDSDSTVKKVTVDVRVPTRPGKPGKIMEFCQSGKFGTLRCQLVYKCESDLV